ncbi:hypothetical protein N7G274_004936 [Stereocaulon virgatum]|uniref:Sfi1 spindle body domain-containing protein n=1 Tax=Stereocaulon virgatum TaxID=373712 RepID=A0ABR4AAE3_9LECA
MPPESPLTEHNSTDEHSPLTDENIAILYQIVKSAEQYPEVDTKPFRAIFAAYENILPENGLDPDHDQIYLRFLFRLGDGREEGQSLYDRFEALLEELGVQLEFVPDEEGIQDATTNITRELRTGYNGDAHFPSPLKTQRRSRRASFASMYDAADDGTPQARSRAESMSRLETTEQTVLEDRPSTRATTRKTEKIISNAASSRMAKAQARRVRLTAEEFASDLKYHQRRHRSVSSQGDQQPQRHGAPTADEAENRRRAPPSVDEDVSLTNNEPENLIGAPEASPKERLYPVAKSAHIYNPSRTQLLRDADTFYNYRIHSVARDVVDKWCFAALQAKDQHEHMDRLASARDKETLLRQAFEHWRLRLHAKKQAIATERYFDHLERRTTRARELQLLSKAFTHWAQCAHDEVLRTSDARERILGMKYFRAWRAITITNHVKTRQQGLRKFFGIWKRCYVRSLTDDIKADLVYQECVSRRAYWQWFWGFCERRAPEWRVARLKRRHLFSLVAAFRDYRRRDQQITLKSNNLAQKRVLSPWLEKARIILSSQREAIAFDQRKQIAHALQAWRLRRRHAPLARQVSNMVDWRVAGVTFTTFVTRFRFEKQAEHVCRLRIMRNALTQWNDRLRCQTLAHRIDGRYCLEVLYKWVVAERYIFLRRLSEERLKQRCLDSLKNECLSRQSNRAQSCHVLQDAWAKVALQTHLFHWNSRLNAQCQAEQIAFEFHAPKIVQEVVQLWIRSFEHLRKLDRWAKDANFYFACKNLLKRWQAATVESKKQKRRNAYMQVRRRSKMSLAASVLQRWRLVSAQNTDMQQQASLTYQNRLLGVSTKLFDYWKGQSDLQLDQNHEVVQHYDRRLIERQLYTWIGKLEYQSRLEKMADLNYDMRVRNVAFGWLHKLRIGLIELKGREANAESLRKWYEKRHLLKLLRRWQDKTSRKLNRLPQEKGISPETNRPRPRAADNDDDPTKRAEDWTEFDLGDWVPALEAQSSITPLPGYLSTPSKRAARAKALVRVSTTPAGTPFESRLRSQLGTTPRMSRRTGVGRSIAALKGSTFGAILEDSPRTPSARRS